MDYVTCSCGKRWPIRVHLVGKPFSCPACGTQLAGRGTNNPGVSQSDIPATKTSLVSPRQLAIALGIVAAWGVGFLLLSKWLGPPSVSDQIHILTADSSSQRRATAVRMLGGKEDERARNAVLAALLDEATEVREAAAVMLSQKPYAPAIPALLESYDRFVPGRAAIVRALGKSSDPSATSGLVARLSKEQDPQVALQLILALEGCHDEQLAESLVPWLQQQATAADALRVLGRLNDPMTIAPIAALVHDTQLRGPAWAALGKMQDSRALAVVREQLHTLGGDQRVLQALAESNNPQLIPLLLETEGGHSPFDALWVLDQIDPQWVRHAKAQELIAELVRSLHDEQTAKYNSWNAARLLGQIGSAGFRPLFLTASDKALPSSTRSAAATALAQLAASSRLAGTSERKLDAVAQDELRGLWTNSIRETDWPVVAGGWSECYKLPGGESVVAESLEKLGDAAMAKGFLESDSAPLGKAATLWAEKNGIRIVLVRPMPGETLEQAKRRLGLTDEIAVPGVAP